MSRRLTALVAAALLLAAACSRPAPSTAERQPKPCAVVYSVTRCQAMTDAVAAEVGKNRDDVLAVAIVPDAPPGGVHLSAGWHIRVRLAMTDGSFVDRLICGGVVHEPACSADPELEVRSATELDAAGTVTVRAVTPGAMALPIQVASMSIPIDHVGEYRIPLGDGSETDSGWTTGTLEFADPWPDDVALRDATVTLDLRAAIDHPRPSLVFDVLWFRPGASLEVRDLNVR